MESAGAVLLMPVDILVSNTGRVMLLGLKRLHRKVRHTEFPDSSWKLTQTYSSLT